MLDVAEIPGQFTTFLLVLGYLLGTKHFGWQQKVIYEAKS